MPTLSKNHEGHALLSPATLASRRRCFDTPPSIVLLPKLDLLKVGIGVCLRLVVEVHCNRVIIPKRRPSGKAGPVWIAGLGKVHPIGNDRIRQLSVGGCPRQLPRVLPAKCIIEFIAVRCSESRIFWSIRIRWPVIKIVDEHFALSSLALKLRLL
jgi:hypothetical protein